MHTRDVIGFLFMNPGGRSRAQSLLLISIEFTVAGVHIRMSRFFGEEEVPPVVFVMGGQRQFLMHATGFKHRSNRNGFSTDQHCSRIAYITEEIP
jgi:hypothetical protein